MKLPTPNDISSLPSFTVDLREDKILNVFLTKIADDLVKGRFKKQINPCGTVEFVVKLYNVQVDADDITYQLPPDPTDICNKIKEEFENNGWQYCWVDEQTFRSSKETIVKLYPIMPSWKK